MSAIEEALAESRAAVESLLGSFAAAPWDAPPAPGKWSPAQAVEHVALTYEVSMELVEGKPAIRGIPRPLRWLAGKLLVPRVLRTGRFPKGAKAPPPFQPKQAGATPADGARRLRDCAARFEETVRRLAGGGAGRFDHPFFGRIAVSDYVRLQALHALHHRAAAARG